MITTPHLCLFVILAITTGACMGAILELTWDQVDFKRRTINFNPVGREKNNKRRSEVPLNAPAYEALDHSRGAHRLCHRVGRRAAEEHQEGESASRPCDREFRALLTCYGTRRA